jgi:thioredoxin reductase (NADPH)
VRDPITAEVVIIGAGPAGLFQVFELGLLGIKAHVLDTMAAAGGQCTELYRDKASYDIRALPFAVRRNWWIACCSRSSPLEPRCTWARKRWTRSRKTGAFAW